MAFDSHRYINKLIKSGFSEEQARTAVEVMFEIQTQHQEYHREKQAQFIQAHLEQQVDYILPLSPKFVVLLPLCISLLAIAIVVFKQSVS